MTSGCATILDFLCPKGYHWNKPWNCDMIYGLNNSYSSVNVNPLIWIIYYGLWISENILIFRK